MTPVQGPEIPGMVFLEKLGSGGFSDVYLYEQQHPRLKVAVKLLRADALDDAQRRQFAAEADTMAELAEHPFIVPVLGAGTAPDGRPYLVMRYYPPPDLGQRVRRTPMSPADAMRTGIQLASAVETAHRSGIIHRDIKPNNVLVSSYGVPGLTDFGIAGRGDLADDTEHLGVSMPWSPPEVLTGQSNGTVTSDVYSLAATVWHLLVGRSPFAQSGDNSERAIFARILHSKPPSTGRADVPGSLERVLQQAMAKNPEHRPQSAIEFARHLQRIEQEMRYTRTEIVVLEQVLPAASAPPGITETDDDDDLTILNRPVAVKQAQATPLPPRSAGAVDDDLTELRPQVARTDARPGSHDEPTEVRPLRAAPTPQGESAEPAATHTRGMPFGAAAVTAIVVVTAVVGLALANRGENVPPPAMPTPSGPDSLDDLTGGGITPDPDLKATVAGDTVTFRVSAPMQGARYEWSTQVPGEAMKPRPGESNQRSVSVRTPSPGSVCAEVLVFAGGGSGQSFSLCEEVP